MNKFLTILSALLTAFWAGATVCSGLYSYRGAAFLLAALAAAIPGAFLIRLRFRSWLAALVFLILPPWGGAILSGLAIGGIAALPPDGQAGKFRKIFVPAFAATILIFYFSGVGLLFKPMLGRWAVIALGASAFLIWRGIPGRARKLTPVIFIIAFIALPIGWLYFGGGRSSYSGNSGGRIEATYNPAAGEGALATASRHYRLPRDFARFEASALIASLLAAKEGQNILFLGEIPATTPDRLRSFRWVSSVDAWLDAGAYGEGGKNFSEQLDAQKKSGALYDLIFISELPASPMEARRSLLNYLVKRLLAPGGVLVAPREYEPCLPPFPGESIPLPGSNGMLMAMSASPEKLSTDLIELDRRLSALQKSEAEPLLASGSLPILYSLPPPEMPHETNRLPGAALESGLAKARAAARLPLLLGMLGAGYFLARFWAGRYPGAADRFAGFESGAAAAMLTWCVADYLAGRQFFTGYAISLLPAMVFLLLPGGTKMRLQSLVPILLTACWMTLHLKWPLIVLPLCLFAAMRELRRGLEPSGVEMVFSGAIAGTLLANTLNPTAALIAAVLLPLPRLLKL